MIHYPTGSVLIQPPQVSPDCLSFVQGLLKFSPENRLTASEIRSHPFFKDIDWDGLEARTVPAPFIPVFEKVGWCCFVVLWGTVNAITATTVVLSIWYHQEGTNSVSLLRTSVVCCACCPPPVVFQIK